MDMHSRNQYLKRLQERYFQARSKKEKSSILDEYCRNTNQNRKYVIRKINSSFSSKPKKRKKGGHIYDGYVTAALAKIWEIFDYPCGQRLAPSLKTEVSRLRQLEEIIIPNEVAKRLVPLPLIENSNIKDRFYIFQGIDLLLNLLLCSTRRYP